MPELESIKSQVWNILNDVALGTTSSTASRGNDPRLVSNATNIIFVDGNRVDSYVEIGSNDRPFKTLTDAIIYWNTLGKAASVHIAPATYTGGSQVSLPAYELSVFGNGATFSTTGNFTINANYTRYNLNTSGNVIVASGAKVRGFAGSMSGNLTVNGSVHLYNITIIGDLVVNGTVELNGVTITGNVTLNSGGSLTINDSTSWTGAYTNNGGTFKYLRQETVLLTSDQTIAGIKTFSSGPIIPTQSKGTNTQQAASCAFVLQNAISGSTPSHAYTHNETGQDPVTISINQVTGLETELLNKQPLDDDLTSISNITESGFLYRYDDSSYDAKYINIYGDVSGSGFFNINTILTDVDISTGVYGGANEYIRLTVDSKGRIVDIESGYLEIQQSQVIDLVSDLSGKSPSITPINAQTGTTYSLVAADAGKIVTCTNASAITVTVPASTFSAGQSVIIGQGGAGQVTLAAGSGMTLHTTTTLKAKAQYARIAVMFDSTSEGTVIGERAAS